MSALRRLYGIDVTDDVGNCDVRSRQFFDETSISMHPVNRRRIAVQLDRLAPVSRDRVERIVIDFGTGDNRQPFVEKVSQLTNDTALSLAAQAEKYGVVLRENRVNQLRNHAFVVPDDTGKKLLTGAELLKKIGAQLLFDRYTLVARFFKFTQGLWQLHVMKVLNKGKVRSK